VLSVTVTVLRQRLKISSDGDDMTESRRLLHKITRLWGMCIIGRENELYPHYTCTQIEIWCCVFSGL